MTFECVDPIDRHLQMCFAGPVSTRASKQSLEIGMYGGHKLFASEADIDSEGLSPAWSVPIASKKETPTVLMKHNAAELELPDELQLDGPAQAQAAILGDQKERRAPSPEACEPNRPLLRDKLKIGPRAALNARIQEGRAVPQQDADEANDKKRPAAQTYPPHLVNILT